MLLLKKVLTLSAHFLLQELVVFLPFFTRISTQKVSVSYNADPKLCSLFVRTCRFRVTKKLAGLVVSLIVADFTMEHG